MTSCTLAHPHRASGMKPLARLGLALAVALISASSASAQVPDKAAATCIRTANASAALLAKAHTKLSATCASDVHKGATASFSQCVDADAKGRVAKARAVASTRDTIKCAVAPPFGYTPPELAAEAVAAAANGQLSETLGDNPDGALSDRDKTEANCQKTVLKGGASLLSAHLKVFNKCKASVLKAGSVASAGELEDACFDDLVADPKGKLAKAEAKLAKLVGKKCEGINSASLLPGTCADAQDLGVCIADRSECAACRLLNGVDGLERDCDLFDDGSENDSCSTCGNGIVEVGEDCDEGIANGQGCCGELCQAVANDTPCDDGLYCTETDSCQAGVCTGSGDPCSAGGDCNDTCNENEANCFADADAVCSDDNEVCTDDVCDGAGSCVHPNNTSPCDDGDPCTTLDTCSAGICTGSPAPAAATVLSEDFDTSFTDWFAAEGGVTDAVTIVVDDSQLMVTEIETSVPNEWGYLYVFRDVSPTQDFRLTFQVAWDSLASNVPIQEVGATVFGASNELIAAAFFNDAWAGTSGALYWQAGCDGCSGATSRGSQPLAGAVEFTIERVSDQVTIRQGSNTLMSVTATTAEVARVELRFGHWRWSSAGSAPTFGKLGVDYVTLEAINTECPGG